VPGTPDPTQIRGEFWACLQDTLAAAGVGGYQRDNYIYVSLPPSGTKIILTAPTRTGGVECKLSLAGAGRTAGPSAQEIWGRLHREREAIEADLGYGPLEWGSAGSSTRVYLRRSADLGDRRTWNETTGWLLSAAERFRAVFGPRLTAITTRDGGTPVSARSRPRRLPPARETPEPVRKPLRPRGGARSRLGLERRLACLRDRFGLRLERPLSRHGEAWSLQSKPGASGSHVHRYVYALWWRPDQRPRLDDMVAWVLLNPSTSDTDNKPRPTLGYCRNRSQDHWDAGGLLILNLFAYRATRPRALRRLTRDEAVGEHNDANLSDLAPRCEIAIAAWGQHGALHGRSGEVLALLPDLYALVNRDGQLTGARGEPSHPRWLPQKPVPYPLTR
jgi:hypothetical protein